NSPVSLSLVAKPINVENFLFKLFVFAKLVLPGKIPVIAASGNPQKLAQILDAVTVTQLIHHLKPQCFPSLAKISSHFFRTSFSSRSLLTSRSRSLYSFRLPLCSISPKSPCSRYFRIHIFNRPTSCIPSSSAIFALGMP